MKRTVLVIGMLIAVASTGFGWSGIRFQNNDEAALKQLVKAWADAAVQADQQKLDRFADDKFSGNAEGMSFNKKMLAAAIRSGQMKVAAWDCNKDNMKVNVRGNAAVVTGRCTLSNATYMGKDFSGDWDFTDRFVKQRDGSWRAVSSQAKRIKQ
jgi:ketosteroid isomerase-like protein